MAKFILSADNHIAQHKRSILRLYNCIDSLKWIFETAKQRNIKNVILAGDLFQDREKIDIIAYHLTFDIIYKYCSEGINLWILLGNHDLWFYEKWDIHSIRPFAAIENLHVIDKPCTLEIEDTKFDFLPFTHNPIQYINDLNSEILIGHLAIDGAKLTGNNYADVIIEHESEMTRVRSDLFAKWKKVFLGHYHEAQKIGNIEYIGSPLELTWGEADSEKHIIEFDSIDFSIKYIVNDFSPKHILLKEEDIDGNKILRKNFIKVLMNGDLSSTEILQKRKKIEKLSPASLEIILSKQIENEHFVEDAKSIMYDLDKMLEEYINSVNVDNLNKDTLLEKGKKVIQGNKK